MSQYPLISPTRERERGGGVIWYLSGGLKEDLRQINLFIGRTVVRLIH